MLKVLEESTAFLEGELRKRGVVSEAGLVGLRDTLLSDTSDLEVVPSLAWASNYVDGDWQQRPTMMD